MKHLYCAISRCEGRIVVETQWLFMSSLNPPDSHDVHAT